MKMRSFALLLLAIASSAFAAPVDDSIVDVRTGSKADHKGLADAAARAFNNSSSNALAKADGAGRRAKKILSNLATPPLEGVAPVDAVADAPKVAARDDVPAANPCNDRLNPIGCNDDDDTSATKGASSINNNNL